MVIVKCLVIWDKLVIDGEGTAPSPGGILNSYLRHADGANRDPDQALTTYTGSRKSLANFQLEAYRAALELLWIFVLHALCKVRFLQIPFKFEIISGRLEGKCDALIHNFPNGFPAIATVTLYNFYELYRSTIKIRHCGFKEGHQVSKA